MKYGPTRDEQKVRPMFSLAGLALMSGALPYRGIPKGPAFAEVAGRAGVLFGGSAILSIRCLMKPEDT